MNQSINSYLKMLRNELGSTLLPEDETARRAATYCHRTLTMLLLGNEVLPQLQQRAVEQVSTLLDPCWSNSAALAHRQP